MGAGGVQVRVGAGGVLVGGPVTLLWAAVGLNATRSCIIASLVCRLWRDVIVSVTTSHSLLLFLVSGSKVVHESTLS